MQPRYAPTLLDEAETRFTACPTLLPACSSQEFLQSLFPKRNSKRQLSRDENIEGAKGDCESEAVVACKGAIADHTELNPGIGDFVLYPSSPWPYWEIVMVNEDGTFEIAHELRDFAQMATQGSSITIDRVTAQQALHDQMKQEDLLLGEVRKILKHPLLFKEEAAKACYLLASCLGPAVPWVRMAALAALLTQVVMFVLTKYTTNCVDVCVVTLPKWVWLALILVFLGRAFAEYQALTYALPFFATHVGFSICCMPVPVYVWISIQFVLSQFSFADVILDTFFTSTSTRMLEFDKIANQMWLACWQQSTLHIFPAPNLRLLILGSWSLLFVQMLVPMLSSVRNTDLKCTTRHKTRTFGVGEALCTGQKLKHREVLFSLADAGCLVTLQAMVIPIRQIMPTDPSDAGWRRLALADVENVSKQIVARVLFTHVLENAAQLKLQSTLYAIFVASAKLRNAEYYLQKSTLLSLGTSVLMSLLKLLEVKGIFECVWKMERLTAHDADENTRQLKIRIWRNLCVISGGCIILILSITYTSLQLAMAHQCKYALWNINGCVQLNL